jgi:hypothetical protein
MSFASHGGERVGIWIGIMVLLGITRHAGLPGTLMAKRHNRKIVLERPTAVIDPKPQLYEARILNV